MAKTKYAVLTLLMTLILYNGVFVNAQSDPEGDVIIGVSWNSDGTQVAMGSVDGDITIWNSSGALQTTFSADALPVVDIAWHPTLPARLATATEDPNSGAVLVWDVSGSVIHEFATDNPACVLWLSENTLISGSYGDLNTLRVWNTDTRQEIASYERGAIFDLALNPQGTLIAIANPGNAIGLISTSTFFVTNIFSASAPVFSVDWDTTGTYIAAGNSDGSVEIWNVNLEQRQPDMILQGGNGIVEDYFTDRVLDVQFVENNTQLLSVTGEGIVRRWDAQTGTMIAEAQLRQTFYGAAFSPDGGQLAYGVTTRDGVQIVPTPTAQVDADVPALFAQQTTGSPYTPTANAIRAIDWHPDGVTLAKAMQNGAKVLAQNQGVEVRSIAWSPDGSQIALGGGLIYCGNDPDTDTRPYGITILDATTRQPITTFEGHVCAVNSVACNFDGSKLASASDDGTARVWDTTTGQLLSVLQDSYGRGVSVTGLAWSPDGQKLAHFVDMGRSPLIIWDPNTGETLTIIDVPNDVESLAWSPDGDKLAIGNYNNTVQILDVETGQILNTFDAFDQDGRVASVNWSPDGSKLAVGGIELRILDAQNGQLLLSLDGHTDDSTIFVLWNPDGHELASVGGLDNSVRIWDTDTGLQLGVFPTQQQQLFSVTWSPDGSYLAYATSGDAVQIVPTPQLSTPTTASMPTQGR